MKPPSDIKELRDVVDGYNASLETGLPELYPEALKFNFKQQWFRLIFSILIHLPLWILRMLFSNLHFWYGVKLFSKFRVLTDSFSYEPIQCGLNDAYTSLGFAMLKSGDVSGAIQALKLSGFVWPCPHNSSFGLRYRLVKALEAHPEAKSAVDEYKEIAKLFNGQDGPLI